MTTCSVHLFRAAVRNMTNQEIKKLFCICSFAKEIVTLYAEHTVEIWTFFGGFVRTFPLYFNHTAAYEAYAVGMGI
jgi:hypothetical protein